MPEILSPDARTVKVALGTRSYDIVIGPDILSITGEAVGKLAPGARCVVVTDENVAKHHLAALVQSLRNADIIFSEVVLPVGETTKSFRRLTALCDTLLDTELERGDLIIALGGGVIGDLAGFAASIFKRGIRFVQIPTTLLAQVDSSVGGKTGINTRHGKNLIGTFHQPSLVIADTHVLDTLDKREFASGYAEVAKYGVINDAAFFDWLENNVESIFSGQGAARIRAIEESCKAKAAIVAADEREGGVRALLNLGHTFGHAVEAWAGYSSRLTHGEGVAIGMVLAAELSEEMGLCAGGAADRIRTHLEKVGLPVAISDMAIRSSGKIPSADELISLMLQDKKVTGGKMTFILMRGIGSSFISNDVTPEMLRAFLAKRCGG
jgi:3-dehydroquinate synthase